MIIVTGSAKRAIEDHFDVPNSELIKNLQAGGKTEFVEQITKLSEMANFIYIRQHKHLPYGNATPAKTFTND